MEIHRQQLGRGQASLARLQALRRLTTVEQYRILEESSEAVASLYAEDLAKPVRERELTAFTALDGEPVLETPANSPERKLAHVA
jgi:hypothetical protein